MQISGLTGRGSCLQQQVPWKLNWDTEDWPGELPSIHKMYGKKEEENGYIQISGLWERLFSAKAGAMEAKLRNWRFGLEGGLLQRFYRLKFSAREPFESITDFDE